MTTLGKLVKQQQWTQLESALRKHYPQRIHKLDTYQQILQELKLMKPQKDTTRLRITPVNPNSKFGPYLFPKVTGIQLSGFQPGKQLLGFIPWNQWLGMIVDKLTLKNFEHTDIVCHCIRTMTIHAYNQITIKQLYDNCFDEAALPAVDRLLDENKPDWSFLDKPIQQLPVPDETQNDNNTNNNGNNKQPTQTTQTTQTTITSPQLFIAKFYLKKLTQKTTLLNLFRKYVLRKYLHKADIWGLHNNIAPFIERSLNDFRNSDRIGTIADGDLIPGYVPYYAWEVVEDQILQHMIQAFHALANKHDRKFMQKFADCEKYDKHTEKMVQRKIQQGLDLFAVYYTGLWD